MFEDLNLTKRQKKVLESISDFIAVNTYPPTIRELAEILNFSSPKGVSDHLDCLKRKGYIERRPSARAIKLTGKALSLLGTGHLPLVGRIAAGKPILAGENIGGYVSFSSGLLGGRTADFALRVRGDSMTGSHILDGDIIAVRSQSTADNGDIVVALIGDEAVVKKFYKTEKGIELRSSNPRYKPIKAGRDLVIQGKVLAVARSISR